MDSWRVLFPWCKFLCARVQLQEPAPTSSRSDWPDRWWLLVTLPKHQRNATLEALPKIRESLILFSVVAAVDSAAFCDILREKCGMECGNIKFEKLGVIFVVENSTNRSLVLPETVGKALLGYDGAAPSEDFLLAMEEVERVAEQKLGSSLPKLDIPFCLHFAPRDINLVGLEQYLRSVQRVLGAVMPKADEQTQEEEPETNATNQIENCAKSGAKHSLSVLEAVQLNLREFELNESVARALKDLVLTGVKVSCLQLPLKSTDFLSEDECPRQPLADCLLAITGGGPRAHLFSSSFAPEPHHDELHLGARSSQVETVVVNDADIDDRRFAALCSALRGATGVKELMLESAFAQDARDARAVKWMWLAYALFTPNGEESSVKKLVIHEPQLYAEDVAAIASMIHARKPARELLDPLWAEHEAQQRQLLWVDGKGKNRMPQPEEVDGVDMVQLKKNTVVYLEPICSQEEWLQTSIVLEQDTAFPIMNAVGATKQRDNNTGIAEEWAEILVPGYGKCWVDAEATQETFIADSGSLSWSGITDLTLVTHMANSSTDKVLTRLFQLVGHDLVSLVLHTNKLREQGLNSILRSCPSLRRLELVGAEVGDMFAFTHGYDVGYCQIESLSLEHFRLSAGNLQAFAEVLSDPERKATRFLRELCVGKLRAQDIDSAIAGYERMLESFGQMLDKNNTIESFKLYIEGEFYTRYAEGFLAHNLEKLPPAELPSSCKMAFLLSIFRLEQSGFHQHLGEHLVRRIFRYAARRVAREVVVMKH